MSDAIKWGPWKVVCIPSRHKWVVQRDAPSGHRECATSGERGRTTQFKSEAAAQRRADELNAKGG